MTDKQDHVKRSIKPATGDLAAIFAALEKITPIPRSLEERRSASAGSAGPVYGAVIVNVTPIV